MTIVSPNAPIVPSVVNYNIPGPLIGNVTPFTYRDGMTYLEYLESFRTYIQNYLIPALDSSFDGVESQWATNVGTIVSAVNEALAEQSGSVDVALATLTDNVNAAIALVISDSIDVQDPVINGIIANPESASRIALNAAFAAKSVQTEVESGRLSEAALSATFASEATQTAVETGRLTDAALTAKFAIVTGAETFVAKDDMKAVNITAAVAGDSTADETSEWFWRGLTLWAADRAEMSANGFHGYGDNGPYTSAAIQAGSGFVTRRFFDDTFDRAAGDLYGSLPNLGIPYAGGTEAWFLNGLGKAVSGSNGNSASQSSSGFLVGGARRMVVECSFDTAPGATTEVALMMSFGQNASNRIIMRLTNSTAGAQTWQILKVIAGVQTALVTDVDEPLPDNAITNTSFILDFDGTNVLSATINGVTISTVLTAPDIAAIFTATQNYYFQPAGANAAGKIVLDRVYAESAFSVSRSLTVYNGAKSGSTVQHAIDRLDNLYPAPVDVLFVSYGHNYGPAGTPAAFLEEIDRLCTAYRADHPESGIVICSQNPQFDPSATGTIASHLERNAALRGYAAKHGYGYLPVYEFYAAQPDAGKSWVQSDGVHPKRNFDSADPNNGSFQIATLLKTYLTNLSNA